MSYIEKHSISILSAVVVLAFFISILYSFYYRIQPIVDARAYDTVGWNIARGIGYFNPDNPAEDSVIRRPGPGYEYFLGGVYWIFGHSYEAVWVIQALFHALSALLVFLIARKFFQPIWHPAVGIGAAALVAFSPDLILASAMLMTENAGIFLMLLSIYLFSHILDAKNSWACLVGTAVVVGLAVMTRSTTLLILVPMLGYILYNKEYVKAFALVCIFCLTFVPWTLTTYRIYGELLPLGANLGLNLSSGNYHGATGELDPTYVRPRSYDEFGPVQSERMLRKEAIEFIKTYPLEFLKLTIYRASIYFSFLRPTGWWPYLSGIDRWATLFLSGVYAVVLFTLAGIGILSVFWQRAVLEKIKTRFWLLILMVFALPLGVIFITVETRYRYPLYPLAAMFAGYAAYCLFKKEFFWKPIVYAVLILGANTLFDGVRNIQRILERFHAL